MLLRFVKHVSLIYNRYERGIKYLLFGGVTFVLSLVVYSLLVKVIVMDELIANAISWGCGATFSFFTSKQYVFKDREWRMNTLFKQAVEYYGARIGTLLVQEVFLYVLIDKLMHESICAKVITEIIVILLNYVASRFWIFLPRQ